MAYSARASGLGNTAAYQVAGRPFLTGSLVQNGDGSGKNVKVAFSATGITGAGGEHFLLAPVADGGQPLVLDVKCTSIFFRGSEASGTPSVSVYASLTGIPITECYDNWSGATGV